jgi:hypothetical protein
MRAKLSTVTVKRAESGFNLKIDNFSLCGLRFHEEVFITESEGLQVIGVRPDWLRNLDLTHRHLLKEKGFSFETNIFLTG